MVLQTTSEYDVLVAGGGPAGIVAAIAAARAGARTALVEQNGFVGGVAAMGLPLHGFFNNREEQIVAGIPWEMVSRLKEMDAAVEVRNVGVGEPRGKGSPKFNARCVAYQPEAYKYLALQMLREAGVDLMLHAFASDVALEGNAVAGLVVENKSGRVLIPAKCIVDCTGDADVAARAGAPFEKGRLGDGALQPVTPLFVLSNVDLERAQQHAVTRNPNEIVGSASWRAQCGSFRVNLAPWADDLRALFPHFHLAQFNFWVLGDGVFYAGNMIHLAGVDASDADQLSRVEADSRKLVWELGEFARRRIPGFEQARIVSTMPYVGVRETRRIVGEYTLDYADVIEARRFDDVVALCGYRVDIHGYDGGPVYDEPERGTQVKDYGAYDIPYRSLVPQMIERLLIAGRMLSATHEAQGSARVMGTCMAMGHATGTAAALSVQQGVAPREVDVHLLQQTLLQQGAFLGEALAPLKPTPIPQRPISR